MTNVSTPRHKNKKPTRRVVVAALVSALAVGSVGIGAATTLQTSINNNTFKATPLSGDDKPKGVSLKVTGEPISHTFDTKVSQDSVVGEWELTNNGTVDASYDGFMVNKGGISEKLAESLDLFYGEIVDGKTEWRSANTLADPYSFKKAVSAASELTLKPGETLKIPVRINLESAKISVATAAEAKELTVISDFNVQYMEAGKAEADKPESK